MTTSVLADLEGIEGARVLTRLDLNVPIANNEVQDDTRILAAVATLNWLGERASVIAACSHLGKAKGSPDPAYSLAPVAPVLAKALGRPVRFVEDCLDPAIADAEPGTLLLLENLRFHPGEKADDPEFAAQLAAPFTHYVNDAFGDRPPRPRLGLGGAARFPSGTEGGRVPDGGRGFGVVTVGAGSGAALRRGGRWRQDLHQDRPTQALLDRVQTLLIGGGMANTFLKAQGHEIGRSLVEDEMLATARAVMDKAAGRGIDLLVPTDVMVTNALDHPSIIEVVASDAIPSDLMVVDLGPTSIRRYAAAIAGARTVFWNGPMGVFEVDAFSQGTMAIATAMAECPGFTVVGGGESVLAIRRAGVADRIDHVSTGGGASLAFLTGDELPALAALEE